MGISRLSIVELFSGIGSQALALNNVASRRNIDVIVENTCEWDIHSIIAYDIIHNDYFIDKTVYNMSRHALLQDIMQYNISINGKVSISEKTLNTFTDELLKKILSSIYRTKNLIDVRDVKGRELPSNLDILTYSFPCQDLSNVGALHGYNKGIDRESGSRSGLLWEVERILLERRDANLDLPKVLLLENVTALEAKRHSNNFQDWQDTLKSLGYYNKIYKLYAPDFGIPQNRKRLIMLSYLTNTEEKNLLDQYYSNNNLEDKRVDLIPLINFLHLEDHGDYFEESKQAQPNDTPSRVTIWEKNPKILNEVGKIKNIVQTITTKQDRHPNSGNIYFDYEGNVKSKFRFLTPRECFQLMGFKEEAYQKLLDNNFSFRKGSLFFSRDYLYKLAGNSIVVNVLEGVFEEVIDILTLLKENSKR